MPTKTPNAQIARNFRRLVKGELAARGLTVGALAKQIGRSRNAVSRAINRGEFPAVQSEILNNLALGEPALN